MNGTLILKRTALALVAAYVAVVLAVGAMTGLTALPGTGQPPITGGAGSASRLAQ